MVQEKTCSKCLHWIYAACQMQRWRMLNASFTTLKDQRMLPFNEINHDPVRHKLDRLLLTEVLDNHI